MFSEPSPLIKKKGKSVNKPCNEKQSSQLEASEKVPPIKEEIKSQPTISTNPKSDSLPPSQHENDATESISSVREPLVEKFSNDKSKTEKLYECDQCDTKTKTLAYFRSHMRDKHNVDQLR